MDLYKSKDVKTRKLVSCFLCGIKIQPGTVAHYESGKYDGTMFSRHSHEECSKEWNRINKDYESWDGESWIMFEESDQMNLTEWREQIRTKYPIQ